MCRIYGYWKRRGTHEDRSFEPGLDAASIAMLSGGPDEQRQIRGEHWGLGCNRLSIQDPVSGAQPFSNVEKTLHLAFNGEIYNFHAIKAELLENGVHVEGQSDGSVLLPYYELYGDAFVDRLEGMFAIAVADLREKRLKLWSDPLAIKSIYYSATPNGVAFASELPGLSALIGSGFKLDPFSIDRYLNWQCLPNGSSLFDGVSCLHPGEQLVFDGKVIVSRSRPSPSESGPVFSGTPDGLKKLLRFEVTRMSQQSAPIAVQVSGGLDSSILATLLREGRTDVTGFHVTHEGDDLFDERRFGLCLYSCVTGGFSPRA